MRPKVNIQFFSKVSEQKFKGQNSTQRQTKEKVRMYAANFPGDSLTHLDSYFMRRSFCLCFNMKLTNQETMQVNIQMMMQEK